MNKTPFLSLEKAQEIIKDYPTPFHIYDEKGIRENVISAFAPHLPDFHKGQNPSGSRRT